MSARSQLISWAWGTVLALPALCLLLVAEFTAGWQSITALILMFAYVTAGIVIGVRSEGQAWSGLEDAFDCEEPAEPDEPEEPEADQEGESRDVE